MSAATATASDATCWKQTATPVSAPCMPYAREHLGIHERPCAHRLQPARMRIQSCSTSPGVHVHLMLQVAAGSSGGCWGTGTAGSGAGATRSARLQTALAAAGGAAAAVAAATTGCVFLVTAGAQRRKRRREEVEQQQQQQQQHRELEDSGVGAATDAASTQEVSAEGSGCGGSDSGRARNSRALCTEAVVMDRPPPAAAAAAVAAETGPPGAIAGLAQQQEPGALSSATHHSCGARNSGSSSDRSGHGSSGRSRDASGQVRWPAASSVPLGGLAVWQQQTSAPAVASASTDGDAAGEERGASRQAVAAAAVATAPAGGQLWGGAGMVPGDLLTGLDHVGLNSGVNGTSNSSARSAPARGRTSGCSSGPDGGDLRRRVRGLTSEPGSGEGRIASAAVGDDSCMTQRTGSVSGGSRSGSRDRSSNETLWPPLGATGQHLQLQPQQAAHGGSGSDSCGDAGAATGAGAELPDAAGSAGAAGRAPSAAQQAMRPEARPSSSGGHASEQLSMLLPPPPGLQQPQPQDQERPAQLQPPQQPELAHLTPAIGLGMRWRARVARQGTRASALVSAGATIGASSGSGSSSEGSSREGSPSEQERERQQPQGWRRPASMDTGGPPSAASARALQSAWRAARDASAAFYSRRGSSGCSPLHSGGVEPPAAAVSFTVPSFFSTSEGEEAFLVSPHTPGRRGQPHPRFQRASLDWPPSAIPACRATAAGGSSAMVRGSTTGSGGAGAAAPHARWWSSALYSIGGDEQQGGAGGVAEPAAACAWMPPATAAAAGASPAAAEHQRRMNSFVAAGGWAGRGSSDFKEGVAGADGGSSNDGDSDTPDATAASWAASRARGAAAAAVAAAGSGGGGRVSLSVPSSPMWSQRPHLRAYGGSSSNALDAVGVAAAAPAPAPAAGDGSLAPVVPASPRPLLLRPSATIATVRSSGQLADRLRAGSSSTGAASPPAMAQAMGGAGSLGSGGSRGGSGGRSSAAPAVAAGHGPGEAGGRMLGRSVTRAGAAAARRHSTSAVAPLGPGAEAGSERWGPADGVLRSLFLRPGEVWAEEVPLFVVHSPVVQPQQPQQRPQQE